MSNVVPLHQPRTYCSRCGEKAHAGRECAGDYAPGKSPGLQSFYFCDRCGELRTFLPVRCRGCGAP